MQQCIPCPERVVVYSSVILLSFLDQMSRLRCGVAACGQGVVLAASLFEHNQMSSHRILSHKLTSYGQMLALVRHDSSRVSRSNH